MDRRNFLSGIAAGAALLASPRARALGANDRIRIGLIGAGDRGQQDLKDALAQPNIECVGIADAYSRRRDEAKALAPNAQLFDDPARLLDMRDLDAVIIATPLFLHAKHMLMALDAKKDVYCEKTMTWNIAEAARCREAAHASSQVIQIGLQHESEGDHADARSWVQQGLPGQITMVEAWMSRNTPHGKPQWRRPIPNDCTPDHVNYPLFLGGRPPEAFNAERFINWRLYWEFSGGNVTENMVHQIAWLQTVLGLKEPLAATMAGGVFAEKDGRQVPDTIAVTLEYPGTTVLWQSTFSNAHYGLGERILGSNGTIEHTAGSTDMVTGKYKSGTFFTPEKLNDPDGKMLTSESKGVSHMANWFECIRARNRNTNAPVETGYYSAVAAHMSNLAYRNQRRITFDEAAKMQQPF